MAAFLGGQKKRFISQIRILKGRIERPFFIFNFGKNTTDRQRNERKILNKVSRLQKDKRKQ